MDRLERKTGPIYKILITYGEKPRWLRRAFPEVLRAVEALVNRVDHRLRHGARKDEGLLVVDLEQDFFFVAHVVEGKSGKKECKTRGKQNTSMQKTA